MKDPRVVGLIYEIETDPSVGYELAPRLEITREHLAIHVEDGHVRIAFDGPHYSTPVEAREAVRDFTRLWEISAGLMLGPGSFKLSYLDAEMIDLANQSRGIVHASELTASMRIGGPGARAYLSAYPEPPQDWILTPNIELIYDRYERYQQGKEPLAMVAYFCVTLMERAGMTHSENTETKPRRAAAVRFRIDWEVLKKVGDLSSDKSGIEARKAAGALIDWTPEEKRWLKAATLMMISRIVHRELRPTAKLKQINLSDLPPL